jgi:hypothetical protein
LIINNGLWRLEARADVNGDLGGSSRIDPVSKGKETGSRK